MRITSLPRVAGRTLGAFLAVAFLSAALPARAQDLSQARRDMLEMLDTTAKQIEKKFYDPKLKGRDWRGLQQQARERVEKAQNVSQMLTAIFLFVQTLDDSHTLLLPPQRIAEPQFGFEAKGFGDEVRVYELKKDGAAKASGLQLGDRILAVNGVRVERGNIDLLLLAMRYLLPTTALDVVVASADGSPKTVHIEAKIKKRRSVRDWRENETIWQIIREAQDDNERYENHYYSHPDGIGYIQIPLFVAWVGEFRDLVGKVEGSRAIIVDLRDNHGGAVDDLAQFAGYFQSEPTVMAELVRREKTEPIKIKPHKPNFTGPLFVLVDSSSMSAAEMFARHFQKSGRAVIIGDRTAGRVTASRFYREEIAGGTVFFGVQIGEARVVFSGGEELEKQGVTPDQVCLPTAEDLRAERDVCRALALRLARQALGIQEKPPEEQPKSEN